MNPTLLKKIQPLAYELGFDLCSASPAIINERDKSSYLAWIEKGGAAGMDYMSREPEKRLDVGRAFPEMKTVLTFGVSYFQGPFPEKPGPGFGRVARYAWGLDYHEVLRARLENLLQKIRDDVGLEVRATIAVDTKPLLERSVASASGLGFIGKNTVLISPQQTAGSSSSQVRYHVGSWVFLAEVLMDLPYEGASTPVNLEGCGGCTKCLKACPTDAFDGPYRLIADRCISYLTIENKGWIPHDMRKKIGDWIYGCDICQDVCPYNARAKETRWPEFQSEKGVGAWMSLQEILTCVDQPAFKQKWGHTPLVRAKRKGLVRNACVVAGNSGDESLVQPLQTLTTDPEPLVRGHAAWALSQLAPSPTTRNLLEYLWKQDPEPEVRNECESLL